jgi:hypothetical protein
MARLTLILLVLGLPLGAAVRGAPESSRKLTYPIVDTGQIRCYNDRTKIDAIPSRDAPYFGQDAHYRRLQRPELSRQRRRHGLRPEHGPHVAGRTPAGE